MWVLAICILCALAVAILARTPKPDRIVYGVSFNTIYAEELSLNPREVYRAILDELGVRHFRLAAHWPMVEPERDVFDFTELDFQVAEAGKRGADVILAIGRRLPRWPECHVPGWAKELSWEEQKAEIRAYITETVLRYKDSSTVVYWQVENEPFLEIFAREYCGELDEDFLREEIELVRSLDGTRPILVTDSGNLGTWHRPYRLGDLFGTSVYVYFWNPEFGQFRTVLPPAFYRIKQNLLGLFFGAKHTILIELSAEPWLLEPVSDTPLSTQYERMNAEKFEEIIEYARATHFDTQYLWGAEWWYWLHVRDESHMWERAKLLFGEGL